VTVSGLEVDARGTHAALLWRAPWQQQRSVAQWISAGVARGERVVWPGDDANLSRAIAQQGVDLPAAKERDQFLRVSLEELCAAGRQAAVLESALGKGFPGVRVTVPANAVLDLLGEAGYRRFDEELDNICTRLPVTALCRYHLREGASPEETASALDLLLETHPSAVSDGQMCTRRHGDRIVLAGEVDLSSAELLSAWLRVACAGVSSGEMLLDLSQLTFVDVAGCRALVNGTATLRGAAGVVFLAGLQGHTKRVMTLLGIDRIPGMRLP
jgi:anti-anti-sigma factor